MATSLNGWTILSAAPIQRPGPHGRNQGFANTDVADVLSAFMWWWHTELEYVTQWGGFRSAKFNASLGNSASRSNHQSGTATDTNWSKHPFIKSRAKGGSFTAAEHRLLNDFNRRLGGIIRFGWTFHDEMHIEIAPWATRSQVAAAALSVRKSFVPPRKLSDIQKYQAIVGVKADGLHGPGTVRAIKSLQNTLGVSQTGLWDVSTTKAHLRANASIGLGSSGSKVRAWQLKLISLGYDLGDAGADGKFGNSSHRETLKFQSDVGIGVDGKVGDNTEKAMDKALSNGRTGSAFSLGARGQDVREWQQLLASLGYDIGSAGADGVFGSGTDSLTKEFELSIGFIPNGTVTTSLIEKAKEQSLLIKKFGEGRNSVSFFLGSAGDDVLHWQEKLVTLGYDLGKVGADGKFGDLTEKATKAFQQKRNLKQDGMVGPNTLKEIESALSDIKQEEVKYVNEDFLDNLADIARNAGLNVEEIEGWETRTAAPEGGAYGGPALEEVRSIIVHHTATSPRSNGDLPTLHVLLNGNGNTTGPLSQYGLGRDGTVYVIAAGICWHAGATHDKNIQGNRYAIGIEAEHSGSLFEPWPDDQYQAYVTLVEALQKEWPNTKVFGHKEISTTGKVDPNFDMDAFRLSVEGKASASVVYKDIKVPVLRLATKGVDVVAWQQFLINLDYGLESDGDFGNKTVTATKAWQKSVGITVDGVVGAGSRAAMTKTPAVEVIVDETEVQEEIIDEVVETKARYRIAGTDRFDTSAEISRAIFPQGTDRVFLVADGDPAAQTLGVLNLGSILLVKSGEDTIPDAVAQEIIRLKPKEIVAIGLSDVISDTQYDLATKAANL